MKIEKLFILSLFCIFLYSTETLACLCKSESPKKAIKRLQKESSEIFIGTVKEVVREKVNYYKATFTVEKSWKGNRVEEVTVYTEGGCMAWFETGRKYIVYARIGDNDILRTDVCIRTRLVEYADEDIKRLGKPSFTNSKVAVVSITFALVHTDGQTP